MGYFTLDTRLPYSRQITAALARRGLAPVADEEWIVHGPHGWDFPAPIFIGPARLKVGATARPFGWGQHQREALVVVYPHAVYEIEDGDDSTWWASQSDNLSRIPTLRCRRQVGLTQEE